MSLDSNSHISPAYNSQEDTFSLRRSVPFVAYLERLLPGFSPAERLALYIFSAILVVSTLVILAGVSARASVMAPAEGGALTEGVIGSARFINPLLALSEPDRDLTLLIYSGLTRARADGTLSPDLAASYEISEDGLTYTFHLRTDASFHDGDPLTSEDVLYTVGMAQNADIRSPRRADWEGVTATAPDEHTVIFTLSKPYAPFLENTTIGILPAHLWQGISTEEFQFSTLNTAPVGSGPFKIDTVTKNKTGAAEQYDLVPFKDFALGAPHLKKVSILFYSNEEALVTAWNMRKIDSFAAITPSQISTLSGEPNVVGASLPRVFGVFFNQGHAPVLSDASVRAALNEAIDKQAIIDGVLGGYASPLSGPVPPGIIALDTGMPELDITSEERVERVRTILERGSWKFSEENQVWQKKEQKLIFSLATADSPELVATAEMAIAMWKAAGIPVELHVYPLSELNTNVIRPREYDAILFGEVVGRTLDLFAFWHSSQRNDPGLNLALYTNAKTDSLLAEARAATSRKERASLYTSFVDIIKDEQPAVFLYAPELVYVIPGEILGTRFGVLTSPAERFLNIHEWYVETERVWSVFSNQDE